MKYKNLLFLALALLTVLRVSAQDSYLSTRTYFLHKGQKLDVYLMAGDQFKDIDEYKYDAAKVKKFTLNEGGKKTNLMTAAQDSASPVLSHVMNVPGIAMVEMTYDIPVTAIDREVYGQYLNNEGLTKLAETVNNSNQSRFREKKTSYMKLAVMIDKAVGSDFDKPLGQDFELVFKQNPYKLNYGDDFTGTLYFKGKPVPNAPIDVFLKVASGNIYPDRVTTNAKGEFSTTVTREGVYLFRSVRTVASTGTDTDFETIQTAFTFLFNSINSRTSDFKSFGLSDRN